MSAARFKLDLTLDVQMLPGMLRVPEGTIFKALRLAFENIVDENMIWWT